MADPGLRTIDEIIGKVRGKDGKDGIDGADGADGFSPTISVSTITGGHRFTATDKNGAQSFDVLDGVKGDKGEPGGTLTISTISLSASWEGSGPYSQAVTVQGVTLNATSKVDIQLTAAQVSVLKRAGVSLLYLENNSGTLTAWAAWKKPPAMTVQATVIDKNAAASAVDVSEEGQ